MTPKEEREEMDMALGDWIDASLDEDPEETLDDRYKVGWE